MSIQIWLVPALMALVLWGVGSFLPKVAVRGMSAQQMTIYHAFFVLLISTVILGLYGFHLVFDGKGVLAGLTTGITGEMGLLFYYSALSRGSVARVTVVTALYPVVATALAIAFLREAPSAPHWLGIGLSIGAVVMMTEKSKQEKTDGGGFPWLWPACAALALWGVWGFLPKLALAELPPPSFLFYESLGNFAVAVPLLARTRFRLEKDAGAIRVMFAASVFVTVATLLCLSALQYGPVSVIVTLAALYPVISVALARVFLKEKITRIQAGAIVLAMAAVALLAS